MRIDLITALPDLVRAPLEESILRRAAREGLVDIRVHDLRDYAAGKHRQVDDYPFGGEAGMVLKPEPIFACVEAIEAEHAPDEVIYLTPYGERFEQQAANRLSLCEHLVLLAGHYKGIDERVRRVLVTRELSIGDYVLTGGELPALVVIDAVVRLLPGVLGDTASALTDSFQDDLLGAPVYTRPATFRGMEVPAVLRTGDHARIRAWREAQRLERTRSRRPDLLDDEECAGKGER